MLWLVGKAKTPFGRTWPRTTAFIYFVFAVATPRSSVRTVHPIFIINILCHCCKGYFFCAENLDIEAKFGNKNSNGAGDGESPKEENGVVVASEENEVESAAKVAEDC